MEDVSEDTAGKRVRRRHLDGDDWWLLGVIVDKSLGGTRLIGHDELNRATQNERFGPEARLQRGVVESLRQLALHGHVTISPGSIAVTRHTVENLHRRRNGIDLLHDTASAIGFGLMGAGVAIAAAQSVAEDAAGKVGYAVVGGLLGAAFGAANGHLDRATGMRHGRIDELDRDALVAGRALLDLQWRDRPLSVSSLQSNAAQLTGDPWTIKRAEGALGQLIEADVVQVERTTHGALRIAFTDDGLRQAEARYPQAPALRVRRDEQRPNLGNKFKKKLSPAAQAVLYVASEVQQNAEGPNVSDEEIARKLVDELHALRTFTGFRVRSDIKEQITEALEELRGLELATTPERFYARITPTGFAVAAQIQQARDNIEANPQLVSLA